MHIDDVNDCLAAKWRLNLEESLMQQLVMGAAMFINTQAIIE